ncbi:MAG: TIGR03915 family putative DNA repair protein [Lachnospiraceae bacterium]|nr:TIGR03915 family putative DNA repair protein [Lachnospiraceae bacterium]
MIVYTCEDSFEAILTCIYDAWASGLGHRNLKLMVEPVGNLELFCEYRHVDPDSTKVESVIRSIHKKISGYAYQMIFRCAMSCSSEKADIIYRFLLLGFHYGRQITDMVQLPPVLALFELDRAVGNEAHYFREFIRFLNMRGNVLVAHIEPKSDVLTFLAPPFQDRMPSENWMIIDDNRKSAVIHPSDQDFYLTTLTEEEFKRLKTLEDPDDPYIDLWKGFFETIAIKPRENYRCQRSHIPLWYRKHATEFQNPLP